MIANSVIEATTDLTSIDSKAYNTYSSSHILTEQRIDRKHSWIFEFYYETLHSLDADAMWMLGVCYEFGMGIEQDIERAVTLYKQSSEKGNVIGWFFVFQREDERGSGKMWMDGL